jgi:hypothetical protein
MSGTRWLDVYALAAKYGLSTRTCWNIIRDAGLEVRRGRPTERTTVDGAAFGKALKAAPRKPRVKRTG